MGFYSIIGRRVCCCSVAKSCLTLCNPMDCSTPGFSVLLSLLQHHNSKASILWCSVFLMVQLSLLHITSGKTIAFCTFVSKVMSLLFNMLSRFVIAFLPSGKHLLISWLQSPSVLYFGDQENKIYHSFHFYFP